MVVIVALSAGGCAARKPVVAQERVPEVRFIVFGDSQFSRMEVFERMCHEAEALRPDFVIQVGDLINGYTYDREKLREEWRHYKSQIEPITAPFYPVPGNHDTVTDESEEIYGEVWGTDRYFYSFDAGPAHIVVLDSWWRDADDRIEPWQREWLAEDLATWAAKKPKTYEGSVFVFLHSPLWRYAENTPGRQDWNEVEKILRQYPTRLVIGGHTHEHVLDEGEGIDYLVMNSSGGMGGDEPRGGYLWSFLHVSVKGDDIRYATVPAGSILPLDTVNSEERRTIPRYLLHGGALRIHEWKVGAPVDETVKLPLNNNLKEPRRYALEWSTPFGSNVTVEPDELKLELGPGESTELTFRITSPSAQPARESMPTLEIKSEKLLRSGYVSREWEQRYRERAERAAAGENVYTTKIPLEAPVTFRARYDLYVPPVVEAPRRNGAIVIDGKFDEAAWTSGATISDFHDATGGPPQVGTTVTLLYDDDYLYVAARMEEPHMAGTKALASGDIPLTWNDDDLELFFDSENRQSRYTRLFQNIAGTRFNSLPRDVENKYFASTYESAIERGDDYWTLEMRIPWKEMGADAPAKAGDTWGFNIGRHRQQSLPVQSVWGGGIYDPARYGLLKFAEE